MSPPPWTTAPFIFQRWGRTTVRNPSVQYSRAFFSAILINYTFWYLDQGRGTLLNHSTGEKHSIAPGCCLMMHAGDKLEIHCVEPILGAYLHWEIPDLAAKSRIEVPLCYKANAIFHLERSMHRVVELLTESLRQPALDSKAQLVFAAELLFKSNLLQIGVDSRNPEPDSLQDIVIKRLLGALQEDPCRFRTAREMADFTGYSLSHLRTLCQEKTGQSPATLLIQSRMEHAKRYLLHTELAVGRIAETLGYENIYYFSSQFRKLIGMTPSDFRAKRPAI